MELRHLRYFVAVAEELHFARAAERLGIEQSPLSRQIRELEAELGARLFERTTRSTRLTWAGEVFLQDARRVLAAVEAMRRSVKEAASGKRGRVRIGVTEDVSTGRFAQLLAACREQAPSIEVRVFDLPSTQQIKGLRDCALELGFLLSDPCTEDLTVAEVWREPLEVLMPTDHALAEQAAIRLSDLNGERFVMGHPEFGPGCYEQSMSLLRSAGIEPQIADYAFHRATMASLVAAGYGITLAPASFTASATAAVVTRPIADPGAFMTVLAAHRADETAESVRSVLEITKALFPSDASATSGRPDPAP